MQTRARKQVPIKVPIRYRDQKCQEKATTATGKENRTRGRPAAVPPSSKASSKPGVSLGKRVAPQRPPIVLQASRSASPINRENVGQNKEHLPFQQLSST